MKSQIRWRSYFHYQIYVLVRVEIECIFSLMLLLRAGTFRKQGVLFCMIIDHSLPPRSYVLSIIRLEFSLKLFAGILSPWYLCPYLISRPAGAILLCHTSKLMLMLVGWFYRDQVTWGLLFEMLRVHSSLRLGMPFKLRLWVLLKL